MPSAFSGVSQLFDKPFNIRSVPESLSTTVSSLVSHRRSTTTTLSASKYFINLFESGTLASYFNALVSRSSGIVMLAPMYDQAFVA